MSVIQVHDKFFRPYISARQIADKINEIAVNLERDYEGKTPLFIAILNGSFMFASDLFKVLNMPAEICFIKLASYKGTKSSGTVITSIGLDVDIFGKHVVILEDIIDTGITMSHILSQLNYYQPKSVKLLTLLFKPKALKTPINPDYVCFEIEPEFVLGYGLDYDGLGRNLPDIYVEMKE